MGLHASPCTEEAQHARRPAALLSSRPPNAEVPTHRSAGTDTSATRPGYRPSAARGGAAALLFALKPRGRRRAGGRAARRT
eukprot:6207431-Pleurochrysis_carterae.AAC.1